MKKLLYFAYGSNLLSSRLEFRVGKVQKVCNYDLLGYRLTFNVWGGFANIIPGRPNDKVEGVLYDLTDRQLKELDHYEGFYYRKIFDPHLMGGPLGVAYIATEEAESVDGKLVRPTLDYMNVLLDGCREQGLKETYNSLLNLKTGWFRLKKKSKHEPWL
jgi:hypothetical protein